MGKNKAYNKRKKILILGGSGFIGNALYKELCNYFDTYGTYNTARRAYESNNKYLHYNIEEDDIFEILEELKPQFIISCLRGNFAGQIVVHQHIAEYVTNHNSKIYFLSSANVFDAYSKYPSYENDKTLSESIYGKFKIYIENILLKLPQEKMAILRLPMVFGNGSPRIKQIKTAILNNEAIEVFPNLIINVMNDNTLTQQIHYLINQNQTGIFHLGSKDLIHHEEFIKEVIERIGNFNALYKRVYTTNNDRYLAVLPNTNKLPKNLQISYQDIINHHVLK